MGLVLLGSGPGRGLVFYDDGVTKLIEPGALGEVLLGFGVAWPPEFGPAPGAEGSIDEFGPIWRGAWVPTAAYVARDLVSYEGTTWIAVDSNLNEIPSLVSSHWRVFAEAGADREVVFKYSSPVGQEFADGAVIIEWEDDTETEFVALHMVATRRED